MPYRCLLVLPTPTATWKLFTTVSIPPFPGLGIRVDTYDVVAVESVVVGDAHCDVTCIGRLEGEPRTDAQLEALGFEMGPYP